MCFIMVFEVSSELIYAIGTYENIEQIKLENYFFNILIINRGAYRIINDLKLPVYLSGVGYSQQIKMSAVIGQNIRGFYEKGTSFLCLLWNVL